MKRRTNIILVLLLALSCTVLYAGPYLGLSQSLASSGLEIGFVNRKFDQNLTLSVPTTTFSFETMDLQTTLLLRGAWLSPVMLGGGLKAHVAWEAGKGYELGMGFALSLSYEFLFNRSILYVEGAYLPLVTRADTALDPMVDKLLNQYVRFGYRYVF